MNGYAYISIEHRLNGTVIYWVIESDSYNPYIKCDSFVEAKKVCKRVDKRRNANK